MFDLNQNSLLSWLSIVVAGLLSLGCIWIAAWQTVKSSKLPILFGHSIPTGFLIGGSLLSALVMITILGQELGWFRGLASEASMLMISQV